MMELLASHRPPTRQARRPPHNFPRPPRALRHERGDPLPDEPAALYLANHDQVVVDMVATVGDIDMVAALVITQIEPPAAVLGRLVGEEADVDRWEALCLRMRLAKL